MRSVRPVQTACLVTLAAVAGVASIPLQATGEGGSPLQALRMRGVRPEAALLIFGENQGGDLLLETLAIPLKPVGKRISVAVLVEVAGTPLLAGRSEEKLHLEVCAYVIGPESEVADSLTQVVIVDVAESAGKLWESGVKFLGQVEVPPGDYTLRTVVYDRETERFGVRFIPLSVSGPDEVQISPPLILQPGNAWLLAREAPHGDLQDAAHETLYDESPSAALPLATEDDAILTVLARQLAPAPPRIKLRAQNPSTGKSFKVEVEIEDRRPSAVPGIEELLLRIPPHSLRPGAFRLKLSLKDSEAGQLEAPPIALYVSPGSFPDRPVLWTELIAPSGDTLASDSRHEGSQEQLAIQKDYRAALRLLAGGDRQAGLEALKALELDRMRNGSNEALAKLEQAEMEVARELAEPQVESLLPVLLAHYDLYQHYQEQRSFHLSTHSRVMVARLADLYAQAGGSEDSRRLAAHALVNLGIRLMKFGLWGFGRGLCRRALELDGDNPGAFLAMASSSEKLGRYDEALGYLEQLVRVEPRNREAVLRLAVNLLRAEKPKEAERRFRSLIQAGRSDWVSSVAYQELAYLLLQQDRIEAATELLRRGVEHLPGQQTLRIQLAALLERQRQTLEATRVLNGIDPERPAGSTSDRFRYDQWPEEGSYGALARSAEVYRPFLAAALAARNGAPEARP